jgi:phospholipase/carboxylesterase
MVPEVRPASEGLLGSRPGHPVAEPYPPGLHSVDTDTGAEAALAVAPGRQGGPLLLFLHGAGGSAADSLARIGRPAREHGVHVLAPTSAASTWDLLIGDLGRDVAAIDAALAAVYARLQVSRTAIGGFSDGGSYALSLGLANGGLFDAVLAFSPGFIAAPRQEGRPRVWVSHGTGDRVLPVDRCGRRVVRDLTTAGYEVSYDEFDGGHEVPGPSVTSALDWWLAEGSGHLEHD